MSVFSFLKRDPQISVVSTCLTGPNLPFNLPPPLTFLQSLRNSGLQFSTPCSAVCLHCMIFMLFKIQVLIMDFFPGILHWSFTFSWAQVYASPSLFCVMGTMLDFQSPTCKTMPYSKESRPQLATTTLLGLATQSSNLHMALHCLYFPCVRRGEWPDTFWAVWTFDSQSQNGWWCPKGSTSQWEGTLAKYFWENNS